MMLVSDAGKPISRTRTAESQRITSWRNRNRTIMSRVASRVTPDASSTTCEMTVAIAAPRTPSRGKPSHPKISSGSSTMLSAVEIANSMVTVMLSPCELNPNTAAKNRNISTIADAVMVR